MGLLMIIGIKCLRSVLKSIYCRIKSFMNSVQNLSGWIICNMYFFGNSIWMLQLFIGSIVWIIHSVKYLLDYLC